MRGYSNQGFIMQKINPQSGNLKLRSRIASNSGLGSIRTTYHPMLGDIDSQEERLFRCSIFEKVDLYFQNFPNYLSYRNAKNNDLAA